MGSHCVKPRVLSTSVFSQHIALCETHYFEVFNFRRSKLCSCSFLFRCGGLLVLGRFATNMARAGGTKESYTSLSSTD